MGKDHTHLRICGLTVVDTPTSSIPAVPGRPPAMITNKFAYYNIMAPWKTFFSPPFKPVFEKSTDEKWLYRKRILEVTNRVPLYLQLKKTITTF